MVVSLLVVCALSSLNGFTSFARTFFADGNYCYSGENYGSDDNEDTNEDDRCIDKLDHYVECDEYVECIKEPDVRDNVVISIIFKIADYGVSNPAESPVYPASLESGETTLKAAAGAQLAYYLQKHDVITRLESLGIMREGYRLLGWYSTDFGDEPLNIKDIGDFTIPEHDLHLIFVTIWEVEETQFTAVLSQI